MRPRLATAALLAAMMSTPLIGLSGSGRMGSGPMTPEEKDRRDAEKKARREFKMAQAKAKRERKAARRKGGA